MQKSPHLCPIVRRGISCLPCSGVAGQDGAYLLGAILFAATAFARQARWWVACRVNRRGPFFPNRSAGRGKPSGPGDRERTAPLADHCSILPRSHACPLPVPQCHAGSPAHGSHEKFSAFEPQEARTLAVSTLPGNLCAESGVEFLDRYRRLRVTVHSAFVGVFRTGNVYVPDGPSRPGVGVAHSEKPTH